MAPSFTEALTTGRVLSGGVQHAIAAGLCARRKLDQETLPLFTAEEAGEMSVRARHRTPPDRNSVTGVQLSRSGDQRHSFAEKR